MNRGLFLLRILSALAILAIGAGLIADFGSMVGLMLGCTLAALMVSVIALLGFYISKKIQVVSSTAMHKRILFYCILFVFAGVTLIKLTDKNPIVLGIIVFLNVVCLGLMYNSAKGLVKFYNPEATELKEKEN